MTLILHSVFHVTLENTVNRMVPVSYAHQEYTVQLPLLVVVSHVLLAQSLSVKVLQSKTVLLAKLGTLPLQVRLIASLVILVHSTMKLSGNAGLVLSITFRVAMLLTNVILVLKDSSPSQEQLHVVLVSTKEYATMVAPGTTLSAHVLARQA